MTLFVVVVVGPPVGFLVLSSHRLLFLPIPSPLVFRSFSDRLPFEAAFLNRFAEGNK